jgi:hypothetical protein
MRKRGRAEVWARLILACSELEQIRRSRSELKQFQLVTPDWSLAGGMVNGHEVLVCPKLQHSIETVYGKLRGPTQGVEVAL